MPDEDFSEHVRECNESGKELTQSSVLKIAGVAHVSQSTGENEWYTPPEWIELARKAMGTIDLDPASCETAQRNVEAKKHLTIGDDGLSKKWRGNVWLNPPYSKELIGRFADKCIEEVASGRVSQLCVLVNNATDTAWFHKLAPFLSAVAFPRGRISFHDKTGKPVNKPLQGQMLLYVGDRVNEFFEAMQQACVCFHGGDWSPNTLSSFQRIWKQADMTGKHAIRVWMEDN